MAVIDDERFGALLREAGGSFSVPPSGAADILERARQGEDEAAASAQIAFDLGDVGTPPPTPLRVLRTTVRSHRLLAVAASLVVVAGVAAIGVAVGNGSPVKPQTTAAAHLPPLSLQRKGTVPSEGIATTTIPTLSTPGSPGAGGGTSASAGTGTAALPFSAQGSAASPENAAAPSTAPTTTPLPDSVGQSARIEQTGSLDLKIAKGALAATMTKLANLAAYYNGFVANSQTQTGATSVTGAPSGSVTLEVPVDSFSAVLKTAQAMGKTLQLSTKATDVTGQYVDLQSRIAALQASRQQYLTILAKATSIGDVLAVQAQLDNLQSQIEQLQGQLQVLTSETAYSTLNVTADEATPVHRPPAPHHQSGIAKAWDDSVHGFVNGVEWLLRGAGPTLFVLIVLGVLVFGGRLLWRRVQRHNL